MLVDLSRCSLCVVVLGLALGDLEVSSWDNDVRSVGSAGPFLAIDAVADSR